MSWRWVRIAPALFESLMRGSYGRVRRPGKSHAHDRRRRTRHNGLMTVISELSDDDLALHAQEWRQRALRGEKTARGVAHALETELRQRSGVTLASAEMLDTRPATVRQQTRPWWKFW
jgi:hypothetical protein